MNGIYCRMSWNTYLNSSAVTVLSQPASVGFSHKKRGFGLVLCQHFNYYSHFISFSTLFTDEFGYIR
jgi:hypothetical protein